MDKQVEIQPIDRTELMTDIVSAYLSNNHIQPSEIPALIRSVHTMLSGLDNEATAEPAGPEKLTPAQINKSITPDALISFEDGKSYKALRRHLTMRGLTPEAYRTKWGLPADYPMVSASYSAQRSALAKSLGLGQLGQIASAKASADARAAIEALKTRRGPRKAKEPV